jgi:hypothetical protein
MSGMMKFQKAVRRRTKARIALIGPPGTGKTYSGLALATGIGERIAVIDSEKETASLYADEFNFSVLNLTSHHPDRYIEAMDAAEEEGFDVIMIDSLSHAWAGKDGVLELVDIEKVRGSRGLQPWGVGAQHQNRLVERLLNCKCHLIVTMRSKMAFLQEEVEENGRKKTIIRKVGMQPIQREGLEFEFDIVADMTVANDLMVSKTRLKFLNQAVVHHPGPKLGQEIVRWLDSGSDLPKAIPATTSPVDDVPRAPVQSAADPVVDAKKRTAQEIKEELTAIERALGGREALLAVIGTYPANLEAAKRAVQMARDALAARVDEAGEPFGEEPPPASEPPAERADPPPPPAEAPLDSVGERQSTLDLPAKSDAPPAPATLGVAEFWKAVPTRFKKPDGSMKIEVNDLFGQVNAANLSGELRAVLIEIAHADLTLDAIAADLTEMFNLERVRESAFKNVGEWTWVSYGDMLRAMRLKPATNAA